MGTSNEKESRLSKILVEILFYFIARSVSRNEVIVLETFSFFNCSSLGYIFMKCFK